VKLGHEYVLSLINSEYAGRSGGQKRDCCGKRPLFSSFKHWWSQS